MPKPKPVPVPEPTEPPVIVAHGDAVALPRPARRTEPQPQPARAKATPKVHPRAHGKRSAAVGGRADAGDAFAAWLRTEKGLDPNQRFGAAQLQSLTAEFAARPIHGHRRTGSAGDNHRPNPEHLRK